MKKQTKKPKKATLNDVLAVLERIQGDLKAIKEHQTWGYTIPVQPSPSKTVWYDRTWRDDTL